MANRPIYIPQAQGRLLVRTASVSFQWHPGLSVQQKQRSIASLHAAAVGLRLCSKPLEVSSKSPEALGVALSAFNLVARSAQAERPFSVECGFQSSKVFERGGPYRDLLYASSREAKRDDRLRTSGRLVGFDILGESWPLEPATAFYDWLYLTALAQNDNLAKEAILFDAFTDIEFNPEKSINCQAYSLALYAALKARGVMETAPIGSASFLEMLRAARAL